MKEQQAFIGAAEFGKVDLSYRLGDGPRRSSTATSRCSTDCGPTASRPLPTAARSDSEVLPEPDPAEVKSSVGAKAADYAVGDVIDGRFEILEVLGQGGFSKVYRVRDEVEGEERAFKLFDNAAGYEAVRREIGALRKIHHPNVVEVFWAGKTSAGDWYLITEYIDGESLDEYATGKRHLRDREAIDVALDVLDALVAIHPDTARLEELDRKKHDGELSEAEYDEWMELQDKGLVHRDIKPLNVMLTRTGSEAARLQHRLAGRRPGLHPVGHAALPGTRRRPHALGRLHRPLRRRRDALRAALQRPAPVPELEADGRRVGDRPEDDPLGPRPGPRRVPREGLRSLPQRALRDRAGDEGRLVHDPKRGAVAPGGFQRRRGIQALVCPTITRLCRTRSAHPHPAAGPVLSGTNQTAQGAVSLVVGKIHDGGVSLVADTKITYRIDDTRTCQVYENALPKLVVLRDDLCAGFAGNDPHGVLQRLVALRNQPVAAVLNASAAFGHASFVIASLEGSPRLWQVEDGRPQERSDIGQAWAGDEAAYELFQARCADWPPGVDSSFQLLSSLQWLLNVGQVPSVGGFHTRVVAEAQGFRFAGDATNIHSQELTAILQPSASGLTLELTSGCSADNPWFTAECAVGAPPTIGALAYLIAGAGVGFVLPHAASWEPIKLPATSMPELIEKARVMHGQELS